MSFLVRNLCTIEQVIPKIKTLRKMFIVYKIAAGYFTYGAAMLKSHSPNNSVFINDNKMLLSVIEGAEIKIVKKLLITSINTAKSKLNK